MHRVVNMTSMTEVLEGTRKKSAKTLEYSTYDAVNGGQNEGRTLACAVFIFP